MNVPLSPELIKYASLDAIVAFELGEVLLAIDVAGTHANWTRHLFLGTPPPPPPQLPPPPVYPVVGKDLFDLPELVSSDESSSVDNFFLPQ